MSTLKQTIHNDFIQQLYRALREDIGSGDITTQAIVSPIWRARATMVAKERCVVAGLDIAKRVFQKIDHSVRFTPLVQEGSLVRAGAHIAKVQGKARSVLAGERVALNFLQHLSGVATLTRKFVDAVTGYSVQIMDTRKTTPGLRALEKYAVRVGGGMNHRGGLYDAILIKDNHLATGIAIQTAIRKLKARYPNKPVEIEVKNLQEVQHAIQAEADILLLDNMTLPLLRQAVQWTRKNADYHVFLEASGGVTLRNVRQIAATGVDRISVGALTHSAPAVDLSMQLLL